MPDTYASMYANAGPIAQPEIRRSQYLADALSALRASGERISSPGELGTRLLAAALTQYGQRRQDERLRNAQAKDSANLNQPLLDQLNALSAPPQPQPAPQAAAPSISIEQLAQALGASGPPTPTPPQAAALGTGSGVGAQQPDKVRDALTRLAMLEDRDPQGQQAAASVALNRARTSGMDLADVITQPWQFEPYGNRRTWERGMQVPTSDPRYQQAAQAVDAAIAGQDPSGGALNFYGPETQRALGRPPPDFARQGGGERIGGNVFFPGQFSAPPGYQPPPPEHATPPLGNETMSTNGFQVPPPPPPPSGPPAAGAPPAGPQAPSTVGPAGGQPAQQQPPSINGLAAIPPQQIEYIRSLMGNPDPRIQAQGRQLLQGALSQAMQVPGYHTQVDNDRGVVIYSPDNPAVGQPFTRPIPGWQPLMEAGPSFNGVPTMAPRGHVDQAQPMQIPQQAMNRNGDAQAFGMNAPPGTNITVSPYNVPTVVNRPQEGFQYQGGRNVPIPGSSQDVTAPQVRVPALIAERDRLRPTLEQANMVFQNINAVRRGVEAQSGPGDLAIANGFQQLLNSGMVTSGEIQAQAQSLGLQGQIGNIIQYVRGGGNLTPEARAQFGRLAEQLYVPRLNQLREQVMSRRDLLDQYGPGSFDLVVPPSLRQELGWEPRAQRHQGQPHAQPSAPRRPRLVGSF